MKSFNESVPIYMQLRDEIENAIITGLIKADEMLPSIRSLAQQYQINPQTISRALGELSEETIIYKKRGIGFFVSDDAKEVLLQKRGAVFRQQKLQEFIRKGKSLGVLKEEFITAVNQVYSNKE